MSHVPAGAITARGYYATEEDFYSALDLFTEPKLPVAFYDTEEAIEARNAARTRGHNQRVREMLRFLQNDPWEGECPVPGYDVDTMIHELQFHLVPDAKGAL